MTPSQYDPLKFLRGEVGAIGGNEVNHGLVSESVGGHKEVSERYDNQHWPEGRNLGRTYPVLSCGQVLELQLDKRTVANLHNLNVDVVGVVLFVLHLLASVGNDRLRVVVCEKGKTWSATVHDSDSKM